MWGRRVTVRPSPCPLVVKEEHQVEPLVGLLLPLLPQTEDVFGWDGDGHPVVQQALLGHLWVDDLKHSQPVVMSIFRHSFEKKCSDPRMTFTFNINEPLTAGTRNVCSVYEAESRRTKGTGGYNLSVTKRKVWAELPIMIGDNVFLSGSFFYTNSKMFSSFQLQI